MLWLCHIAGCSLRSRTWKYLQKRFTSFWCFATPFSPISGRAISQYRSDTTVARNSTPVEWTHSIIYGVGEMQTLVWNVLTTPLERGPLYPIILHCYQTTGGSNRFCIGTLRGADAEIWQKFGINILIERYAARMEGIHCSDLQRIVNTMCPLLVDCKRELHYTLESSSILIRSFGLSAGYRQLSVLQRHQFGVFMRSSAYTILVESMLTYADVFRHDGFVRHMRYCFYHVRRMHPVHCLSLASWCEYLLLGPLFVLCPYSGVHRR